VVLDGLHRAFEVHPCAAISAKSAQLRDLTMFQRIAAETSNHP